MSYQEIKFDEKRLKFALKLMKVAKSLGVASLKFGDIEFCFSSDDESSRVGRPTSKVSAEKVREVEESNRLAILSDEIKDDVSVMHVEDPSGFERALIENLVRDDIGDFVSEEKQAESF